MKTKMTILLAILCSFYSFGQTIRVDDLLYHVASANTVEIVGNYKSGVLTIPETITYNNINYQVKTIASRAFANSTGLTSVTIPNSVTDIGQSTFQDCISLTSIIFGNSISNISSYAFSGCQLLNTVIIGTSVTSIDDGAFLNCIGLTSIAIPTTVTNIGNSAFYACTGLTTVTIPNSVTNIGNSAFASCQGLTSVNVANGLISIGEKAFSGCYYLTNINIPNTVTSLGKDLFFSCSDLTSVTVNWTNPLSINRNVFDGLNVLNITLNVPAGTAWTYANAPVWKEFGSILQPIVVPVFGQTFTASGINYIVTKETLPYEAAVGSNSSFVGAATIPATVLNSGNSFAVTSIGDNAFNNCIGLSFVTMPNSITNIGILAFGGCYDLNSVTIPNSVISIGEAAFANCGGLISVAIPDSVLGIGADSFNSCFNLTSVNIPNSVTSIGYSAFSSCSSLTDVTVEWQTPLPIDDSVFEFVPIEAVVLHVPDGTATLYADVPVWQDFFKSKPEVESPQQFCGSATLSEVIVQGSPEATEFKWYDADGNYLESYSQIYSSATYYVSQVVNGIESLHAAVDVNLIVTDTPTVYDFPIPTCSFPITLQSYPNVTGSNLRWYDAAGNELDPTTSIDLYAALYNYYSVSQTIDDCESDRIQASFRFPNPYISKVETTQYFKPADALAMNLLPNDNQWFREANDNNLMSSFDALTDNTYYFVKEYNDDVYDYCPIFTPVLVVIVPAPTADEQTFSGTATVADLIVTATGTIKWYNADGAILEDNVALTTGKYYVTQTIGNLESDTTEVEVTITSLYTAIPDANFEQALFDRGIDTINGDKQVLTSAIIGLELLDVSYKNIASLSGIEAFSSLTELICSGNLLTNLNVNNLTGLQHLTCSNNQLTSLNTTNLNELINLDCSNNLITTLSLTTNSKLIWLSCESNQLTSLNLNGLVTLQTLDCSYNQMTNLNASGTDLRSLNCSNNYNYDVEPSTFLTNINVTGLTYLSDLNCSGNVMLADLNFSGLTNLNFLELSYNNFSTINLSGLPNLWQLNMSNNKLTTLDLSPLIQSNLSSFSSIYNPALSCITVSDPTAAAGNVEWIKDDTTSYATNCNLQQYTAIPDANFEQALFDAGLDTINGDKQVLTSAISVVTILDISYKNISDLTGIAGFTSLQTLYCSDNQLINLDLNGITALQYLDCQGNELTSLDLTGLTDLQFLYCQDNALPNIDLSGLTALQILQCENNRLTSLDLNGITALQYLDCEGNELTSIDLTGLTDLQFLYCQDNALANIDLSGLTALQTLDCQGNELTSLDLSGLTELQNLDCSSNIDLTCISVSDPTAAAANSSWFKDDTANYSTNCNLQEYTAIRSSGFEQALFDQGIDTVNGDFKVLTSAISRVTSLNLQDRNIGDLTGIEGFTSLTYLDCSRNGLSSLNISANTALKTLICSQNGLSSLNITANTALEGLGCDFNQLTSLNISENKALKGLSCSYNSLSSLNISNNTALNNLFCAGNSLTNLDVSANKALSELYCNSNSLTTLDLSTNLALEYLKCFDNSSLSCITVPDPVTAAANLNWLKDATASYAANCNLQQYTAIPDANFEQALFDLGIDTVNGDKQVLTSAISGVKTLNVDNRNISDLTGIEGFTALQYLYCSRNQLTSLNVSGLTALQYLYCFSNQLTSLDLNGLTALQELGCASNQLKSLDLNGLTALQMLGCRSNQLKSLDFSSVTALQNLNCSGNQLTSLDLSSLIALQNLDCQNNALTSLNVSGLTALHDLVCSSNKLTSLDLKDLSALQSLDFTVNQLTSINVSGLKALQTLNCSSNELTNLDLKGLTGLQFLYCEANQISSLDLNGLTAIQNLGCSDNQLTSLNLSALTSLNFLVCSSNIGLTCITVLDPIAAAINNNWVKDATANYSANCAVVSNGSTAAILSGSTAICSDNSATISVAITGGASPYTVVYSNGISNSAVTGYISGNAITVSQTSSTTYSIVSVTDSAANLGTGNSGTAVITVNPKVTPTFTTMASICLGVSLSALPTTSTNGISGTWSPALNNLTTTSYTFTPSAGQCADSASLTITVNKVEPPIAETQVVCSSSNIASLKAIGSNLLWYYNDYDTSPLNSTDSVYDTTYYVSQTVNGCESPRTAVQVTVESAPEIYPVYDVYPCSSYSLPYLSVGNYYTGPSGSGIMVPQGSLITTSQMLYIYAANNCGVSEQYFYISIHRPAQVDYLSDVTTCGSYTLPALSYGDYYTESYAGGNALYPGNVITSSQTVYIFNYGNCGNAESSFYIDIKSPEPPLATAQSFCDGATIANLTATGTAIQWYATAEGGSPLSGSDLLTTKTYYATQTLDRCESTNRTAVVVSINPLIIPTFTAVAAICSRETLTSLPTISNNGILGTWLPALNNLATTTYTFTPSVGQCANTTTLSITVNPKITPTFTAVAAICSGARLSALPTTSTNGITGTWLPALNNLATTTYTFTPSAGQCADTTNLNIAVTPQPARPRLVCYQTATFNSLSCSWDVTGTMPTQPTTACYETATFNTTTCAWIVTGTQPAKPTLACYETATFDTTTCAWYLKGTAPLEPAGLEIQTFVSGTLSNIMLSGSGIKWYASASDASTRTNELPLTTVLIDKTTYYATQTINGCESTSSKAVTVTVTLSVNEFDSKAFAYYPNPVTDELNLSYSYGLTSVKVTDILGRQLFFKKLNENAVKIDMSGMVRGVYFVEVTSDNSSKTIKVVKE